MSIIIVASLLKSTSRLKIVFQFGNCFRKKLMTTFLIKNIEFATSYSLNKNYDDHFGIITYLILNFKKL